MTRLSAAAVRAYLDRGWGELERTATRRDPTASLDVAGALYAQAIASVPGWPSRAERDADFQAHVRLATLFERAHRARPGGARSR